MKIRTYYSFFFGTKSIFGILSVRTLESLAKLRACQISRKNRKSTHSSLSTGQDTRRRFKEYNKYTCSLRIGVEYSARPSISRWPLALSPCGPHHRPVTGRPRQTRTGPLRRIMQRISPGTHWFSKMKLKNLTVKLFKTNCYY